MQTERIAVSHPMQTYTFTVADFAKSADAALFRISTSSAAKIDAVHATMPWGGSVVGIAVKLSTDKTAGSLEFLPTVNGTEISTFSASVEDDESTAYAVQKAGIVRFAAGDYLGVKYVSDANLVPDGTADAIVDLYVVFDKVYV